MEMLERFKKYIAFDTVSDDNSLTYPSTKSQCEFADLLFSDLVSLGVKDVIKDENSIVYARVNIGKEKTLGLIAHMDTAPTIAGGIKNPKLIEKYDGSDIKLNETYTMSPNDFPALKEVIGDDLLVTDGEHLLGGDDKAGVTIIIEFLTYFLNHKDEFNYNLAIAFTATIVSPFNNPLFSFCVVHVKPVTDCSSPLYVNSSELPVITTGLC